VSRCECDWGPWHRGRPCPNEAADHGDVRTSPELCLQCLYVCCKERDDAEDPPDLRSERYDVEAVVLEGRMVRALPKLGSGVWLVNELGPTVQWLEWEHRQKYGPPEEDQGADPGA
jgi:hypothetical protein